MRALPRKLYSNILIDPRFFQNQGSVSVYAQNFSEMPIVKVDVSSEKPARRSVQLEGIEFLYEIDKSSEMLQHN